MAFTIKSIIMQLAFLVISIFLPHERRVITKDSEEQSITVGKEQKISLSDQT